MDLNKKSWFGETAGSMVYGRNTHTEVRQNARGVGAPGAETFFFPQTTKCKEHPLFLRQQYQHGRRRSHPGDEHGC